VRIDKTSIKKNKNAGQNTFFVPGPWRTTETGITRDIQTVRTLGCVSRYSYGYLPTEVVCPECHGKFFHDEIIDDYDEDCDGNSYEYQSCPLCHKYIEIDLEFERFNEAEYENSR
jgi:hypothetical protein